VDATDTRTDRQAITDVVHDYFQSWYEGDVKRMERSLHPNLAKRAPMAALLASRLVQDGDPDALDEDTRQTMVDATARGVGTKRARDS
jgi:ketosteroid isomerase-like protein